MGEFLWSHFNIENGRKYTIYSAYYVLLFQEKWKCNLNGKKRFVQFMEKVLWLNECIKSEVLCWRLLSGWWSMVRETSWSWWPNWDINWEQSMFYHAGDSWHTQNVQISEVIGENENENFYRKYQTDFLANPIFHCLYVPWFVYTFTYWKTSWLFSSFGNYK